MVSPASASSPTSVRPFAKVRYELLTLGDELLLGLTANAHLTFIGAQLGRHGVMLARNVTVTDDADKIVHWALFQIVRMRAGQQFVGTSDTEVLFHLLRSEAAHTLRRAVEGPGDAMRIREAMAFMREHAHERLTVARVARRFGMSESHFAHRFRDVVRVSPMRYIKHERLARARLLMLSEGQRSAEVATRVGYASASQFTRDFKSHFGVPPVEYARRFRDGSAPGGSSRAAGSSNTSAAADLSRERAAS